jgi:hypothetical protein
MAPTDLSVASYSRVTRSIAIAWTNPASPPVGLRVQYSTNGGATWTTSPDLPPEATTFTIAYTRHQTIYTIRVQVFDADGSGSWSASVFFRTS